MSLPPASAESDLPDLFAAPADLLQDLLAVSLTAVNLLRPLYSSTGEVEDFAVDYLNPAAQRMTGLAERPGVTMRGRFPDTFTNGVFALYRQVMETGQQGRHSVHYQADGFDNYFHVAARRSGHRLLVSFTDTADQPRTPVELALRESQAAERVTRAEAEAQRQRFYEVLQHLPAQIATYHGPDHVFTFANERFRSFVPAADLLGRPVRTAAQGAVGEEVFTRLDQVYATGEPVHLPELEVVLDHYNETLIVAPLFVNAFYLPLRDGEGRIHGVLDFSYDVTEQVLARRQVQQLNQELEARVQERTAELRRQQGHLQQILGQVPAAIATLLGPEHRFAFFNDAYQTLSGGRTRAGQRVADLLPEVVAQGFIDLLDAVYTTGRPHVGTETLIAIDDPVTGHSVPHYLDFLYQPLLDEQGCSVGVLAFAVDVTEKVQARQRTAQSESRFRQLAETTPLVVWEANAQGQTIYLSPQWERFTATANGQGLGWREYLHPDDQEGFVQDWLAAVRSEQPFQAELRLRVAATGEYRWHLDRAVPVRDAAGTLVQWVGAAIDIHEQKLAELQLQQLTEQLRAARDEAHALNTELTVTNAQLTRTNADLDTFVYTASHDLRSPITNIAGLLTALDEHLPDAARQADPVPYLFDLLRGAVERFQLTLDQLTDIIKVQQVLPTESIDLAALVEDVRLDLAPLLAATRARLDVTVTNCTALSFAPQHVRSIVYNLLSNALKYHHPTRPPQVQVRCHAAPGGSTVLEVQDNGLGLSAAQQARLFGLFQRLHTHVEGSGVGLYTVKRILDNAGGTIAVDSQPGSGTTFTVTFPL